MTRQSDQIQPTAQLVEETSRPGVKEIIRNNWKYILLLMWVTLGVYANSLPGDFSIVDDIPGIITSGRYDNLAENIKTFHLQSIIYSILINVFGKNPLVFHIFSLLLTLMIVGLAFVLVRMIWSKRVALIASLIFAVHPVTTESVTWISGSPYLINAMFLLPGMISYIKFKRTKKEGYLLLSLVIYSLALLLTRTPWVLTLPIALLIIDQFIVEQRFDWRSLVNFVYYLVPTVIYVGLFLRKAGAARLASRQSGSYLNQQTLPLTKSYIFTIYSMIRLYVFPKDLKIYYDGNVITNQQLIIMVILSSIFVAMVLFFWLGKRNLKVTGLLLLLPAMLAPSFSPIKVTWNMAERYLYLGTLFFGVLVALIILKISSYFKWKYVWILLTVPLLLVLSVRTVIRNNDYLDNKEFARKTIIAASQSVRPYNDLGTLYYMDGDTETALDYYSRALQINRLSATAINNIGLIFLKNGVPDSIFSAPDYFPQMEPNDYQAWLARAISSYKNENPTNAAYYLIGAVIRNPQGIEALNLMGDMYYAQQEWERAKDFYLRSVKVNDQQANIYYKLSTIEATKLGDYQKAKEYTLKTLEIDPNLEGAKKNLEMLDRK